MKKKKQTTHSTFPHDSQAHDYSICSDKGFTLKRQHMIGQGKESWTKRGMIGHVTWQFSTSYNTPSYKVAMIQRSSHSEDRPCPLPLVNNILVSWASLLSFVPIPPSLSHEYACRWHLAGGLWQSSCQRSRPQSANQDLGWGRSASVSSWRESCGSAS